MSFKAVRFNSKEGQVEFFSTLRAKVKEYFDSKKLSRHANSAMVFKTVFMFALYLVPYSLMIGGVLTSFWAVFVLWILMGFGMAGLGLSVMHDANHGAYSSNPKINKLVGSVIYLVGGIPANWRIQHNVLHHSYTNISGMDEDLDPGPVMRFSPNEKRRYLHRFQHIYAWFFYCLMTLLWATTKDFKQLYRYRKLNLAKTQNRTHGSMLAEIIISKAIYYAFVLVLPLILLPMPWYQVLIGFLSMHFLAGLILACIFQPAHITLDLDFPMPTDTGSVENNWAIHELATTTDFAPKSHLFSWYVGGLNFQVVHHLFPNICHVHYKKLATIVAETAHEFGLPYHSQRTFYMALKHHTLMLKRLGTVD
jgi:linoleoyl-CoA desaturase